MDRLIRYLGAALLLVVAAVHLDLYLRSGYRDIPTIGWLFLFNVVASVALATGLVLLATVLVVAAAAGFSLATFAAYLLSVTVGIFGFTETGNGFAAAVAGAAEVLAFALLGAWTLREVHRRGLRGALFAAHTSSGRA